MVRRIRSSLGLVSEAGPSSVRLWHPGALGRRRRRRRERGMTFVELMVASLMLGVSLAGIASAWYFSFRVTHTSDEVATAYAAARRSLELARRGGYFFIASGSRTDWYNVSGQPTDEPNAYFEALVKTTQGPAIYGHLTPKEVKVYVIRIADEEVLAQTRSYIVLGGT